jgi:acyl carrier protein
MEIEAQIKEFIAKNILFSDAEFSHSDDASFLQEGIIDSIGVMELVTYVGTAFGITVSPEDVTPDNFDSVSKLANYIQRKSGAN